MTMATKVDTDLNMWSCNCGDGGIVQMDLSPLIEQSGYFSAMMHSQMRETKDRMIDLRLITSDTMTFLLHVFSLKDTSLTDTKVRETFADNFSFDKVEELLKAIDYLDIPSLYPKCCHILNLIIPVYCTNIVKVWRMWENCQAYGLEAVEEEMFSYVAKNITKIQNSDFFFFRELPLDLLAGILSVPDIEISSEVEVMALIESWISYYKDERIKYLETLFKCIHIPSLIHSDLHQIEQNLTNLDVKEDIQVWKMFSSYVSNPHKFLISRPTMCEIRNGQNVLMLFGGLYEHSLLPHNLMSGNRRRYNVASIPLLYQDITEVCKQCLNSDNANRFDITCKMKCKHSVRTRTCSKTSGSGPFSGGLVLKQTSRLKSPVKLVEFGLCSYKNFVYLAGGQRKSHDEAKFSVKGSYRLDPHLGEWSEISAMKEARCLFYLCEAWGQIFAIGGANQYGIMRSVEYYAPQEDKWYETNDLPTQLHEHAGCIYDNKIYICGGHNDTEPINNTWRLDGKDGQWMPLAPMLQPRSYHAMAVVKDRIYVVGGCCADGTAVKDIYSVEEYDPKTDIWTNLISLNVPISSCLPIVIGNEILFVGSYSFDQKVYLHQTVAMDIESLTWKIVPLEFTIGKRIVGYYCMNVKLKKRLLK